ncbi:hypothetical protein [Herminiimonas sp. CN]|uniref:hypothetical protein n=1 Tax=Herminiimonas sp. CN TaxID=1349818 RepID=UPI0004739099|nr:hypothetical protein [Herminiimonas sp. CN]
MTVVALRPAAKTLTLGKAIDTLWELREIKRAKEAEIKEIEGKIAAAESTLFERLDAEETDAGKGKSASVSITSATSFNITDFDAFAKYVAKTKYFHLFQRRVSEVAAREIFESKGQLPGLTAFVKRRINLRSLAVKA